MNPDFVSDSFSDSGTFSTVLSVDSELTGSLRFLDYSIFSEDLFSKASNFSSSVILSDSFPMVPVNFFLSDSNRVFTPLNLK
jgi:hypothetical protein